MAPNRAKAGIDPKSAPIEQTSIEHRTIEGRSTVFSQLRKFGVLFVHFDPDPFQSFCNFWKPDYFIRVFLEYFESTLLLII